MLKFPPQSLRGERSRATGGRARDSHKQQGEFFTHKGKPGDGWGHTPRGALRLTGANCFGS